MQESCCAYGLDQEFGLWPRKTSIFGLRLSNTVFLTKSGSLREEIGTWWLRLWKIRSLNWQSKGRCILTGLRTAAVHILWCSYFYSYLRTSLWTLWISMNFRRALGDSSSFWIQWCSLTRLCLQLFTRGEMTCKKSLMRVVIKREISSCDGTAQWQYCFCAISVIRWYDGR